MKKVLAVINDEKDIDRVLKSSLNFLDSEGVLEVLYVHESSLFDLPDFFKPDFLEDEKIDQKKIKKRIKEDLSRLGYDKDVAIFVYIDDTKDHIKELVGEDTFVVSAYNEKVTHSLLKDIKNMQLILKKDSLVYKKIALPIDLSKNSHNCLKKANELFEKNSIRVVYDFRYSPEIFMSDIDISGVGMSDPTIYMELSEDIKKSKLDEFYKFLSDEMVDGDFITFEFDIGEDLKNYAKEKNIDLFYICRDEKSELFDNSALKSIIDKSQTDFILTI